MSSPLPRIYVLLYCTPVFTSARPESPCIPVSFQKPWACSPRESSHRHLNLQYALISMDWLPTNGDRCLHRPLPCRVNISSLVVIVRLAPWSIVYRPIGRIPGFDGRSIGHPG